MKRDANDGLTDCDFSDFLDCDFLDFLAELAPISCDIVAYPVPTLAHSIAARDNRSTLALYCNATMKLFVASFHLGVLVYASKERRLDNGKVGSISKSCDADLACAYVAQEGGNVTSISESCTALYACFYLAAPGGSVESVYKSCLSDQSCRELAADGEVGDICNSCNDDEFSCCTGLCKNNTATITSMCGTSLDVVNFCLPRSDVCKAKGTDNSLFKPKSHSSPKSSKASF